MENAFYINQMEYLKNIIFKNLNKSIFPYIDKSFNILVHFFFEMMVLLSFKLKF